MPELEWRNGPVYDLGNVAFSDVKVRVVWVASGEVEPHGGGNERESSMLSRAPGTHNPE